MSVIRVRGFTHLVVCDIRCFVNGASVRCFNLPRSRSTCTYIPHPPRHSHRARHSDRRPSTTCGAVELPSVASETLKRHLSVASLPRLHPLAGRQKEGKASTRNKAAR